MTAPFSLAVIDRDGARLAVVVGDKVAELDRIWPDDDPPSTMATIFADWDQSIGLITAALNTAYGVEWGPVADVTFLPPAEASATLYCAGANYVDHVEEMGAPRVDKSAAKPYHFMLPTAALQAHLGPVLLPPGVEKLDWEVELAAIIGSRAYQVSVEDALGHVAAYTVANDVSIRDQSVLLHPIFGVDFLASKAHATHQPLGPVVVPARFVEDPQKLALRLSVNGEVRQDSTTEQMIFDIAEQIAHLSSMTPLLPGDVVLTGTPAGTAAAYGTYLKAGDVMVAEVEGIGVLENRVVETL